ncbi:hypothetical protein IE53DRAFT_390933 [Violaceomyces palustris]|uniref:Uncharacterized protein n=1 Tax=Violaceomyces palustris TaxID=1673888 RepID=A0ACD0NMA2_9BASI|nr:hypothetical protein IE53DRAFT_390933 [Violaceomyces palustris]
MKVLKPRSALLSDFEVLSTLREMESEQKVKIQNAKLVYEEKLRNGQATPGTEDDEIWAQVPENLRTVQYEAIKFLSNPSRPSSHQTPQGIVSFQEELRSRGYSATESETRKGSTALSKAERLQIVNHAPNSIVELHTLVEELSERFYHDQVEEILSIVRKHLPCDSADPDLQAADLPTTDPDPNGGDLAGGVDQHYGEDDHHQYHDEGYDHEAEEEEQDYDALINEASAQPEDDEEGMDEEQ